MGYTAIISFANFDQEVATASIPASTTTQQGTTVTGIGYAEIITKGDGNSSINEQYIIDGGAAVTFATGNQQSVTPVSFSVSLKIQAVNTDGGGAHPSSSVSFTGMYH